MATSLTCPQCGGALNHGPLGVFCVTCIGRVTILGVAGEPASAGQLPQFGDYLLLEEAGRGAMGVVYKARQPGLNRIVALKMILNGQFAGEGERRRFQAEAEAVAALDHPNIVPVYGFGEHEGRQFCAMRWLEGGPIPARLAPDAAAELLVKVARAVHYAHQRGVLHRDLKPGNILRDEQGEPFVTDFGLAKRLDREGSLTQPGSPVGTPAYMSPELAAGERSPSTAADVWSLGAIFYHLLTGQPPFQEATTMGTLARIREGNVTPPRRWNPRLDRDLETICLKCLRLEPSARYATAAELADDLTRWQRREPIQARPFSWWQRAVLFVRRRPAIATLCLLTVLSLAVGMAGVLVQWQRAEREREDARVSLLRLHTERARNAIEAGDPLGTLPWMASALAAEKPGSHRAAVYRGFLSDTLRQSPLPREMWFLDQSVGRCSFSPDGRRLAFAGVGGHVMAVPLTPDGAAGTPVSFASGGWWLAFTADGERLVTVDGKGRVEILPAAGGKPLFSFATREGPSRYCLNAEKLALGWPDGTVEVRSLENGQLLYAPPKAGAYIASLDFSPDGQHLAVVSDDRSLRVWEPATGRAVGALRGESYWAARYSSDGRRLVVVSRREGRAVVHDAATLQPVSRPMRHDGYLNEAVFSRDGRRVATAGFDGMARVWDAATGEPVSPPLRHDNQVHLVRFSPDGRRVATRNLDGLMRVWQAETGTPLTPWLRHSDLVGDFDFSPDGAQLLTSCHDGSVRLWPLPETAPPARRLEPQPRPVWHTTFSADGALCFASSRNRGRVWRTADWSPLPLEIRHDDAIDEARFSPDGRKLLTGSRDGTVCMWEWDSPQPVSRFRHNGKVTIALWLPDSARVFSAGVNADFTLWDARDGRVLRTFTNGVRETWIGAVAPNGRSVAGDSEGVLAFWSAETGGLLWTNRWSRGRVEFLQFALNGSRLVGVDLGGEVRVLDALTGRLAGPKWLLGTPAKDLAVSPDGRRVAIAGTDFTARIWDVGTGRPLSPPLKASFGMERIRFSPDGRLLATGGRRWFQVWDVATGAPVSAGLHLDGELVGGAFLNANHAVGITDGGAVHEFRLETLPWTGEQHLQVAKLLTGMELDAAGGFARKTLQDDRDEAEAIWQWLKRHLPARPAP